MTGNKFEKYREFIIDMGNFWFMKNINNEIYKKIAHAEREARIDLRNSGHETREVLELVVNNIIETHKLKEQIRIELDLRTRLELVRDETTLKKAGYLSANQKIQDKPLLPQLGTVKVWLKDKTLKDMDYYNFLRRFGNACSHPDPNPFVVNFENVLNCLKGHHSLLRKCYANRLPKDLPSFCETLMPISNYHIYDSYEPADKLASKCFREFLGYMKDSTGKKTFYAVIRAYYKNDVNQTFLMRNSDTFLEASRLSIRSVPEGMTRIEELTKYGDETNPFYIISYIFNREPTKLSEKLIKNMSIEKRVKMCLRVADCFCYLHKLEFPIYHRLLSYESIYCCC